MTTIHIVLLISSMLALYLSCCYADKRYDLRLVDWLNGVCSNPFSEHKRSVDKPISSTVVDCETHKLKARIEVLEKIVSEPAYELNRKINEIS